MLQKTIYELFSFLSATVLLLSANFSYATDNPPDDSKKFLGGEISGNIAFVSNYLSNGLTQTQKGPAMQGNITYEHSSGIYVNNWGSSMNDGSGAYLELGPAIGFRNNISDVGYDLGVSRFLYPKANSYNYDQYYLNLSYKIFTILINYAPKASGTNNKQYYYNASFNYPLSFVEGLSFSSAIGRTQSPKALLGNYTDYNISLTQTFKNNTSIQFGWANTNGYPDYNHDGQFYIGLSCAF